MKRFLSLGAGVQSSTIALMIAAGELPMIDAAIFSDPKAEGPAVYKWLDWLEKQLPYPVYRVSAGDLWESATRVRTTKDGQRSYISTGIPVYTVNGLEKGMGKRQCTRTFKIEPVNRQARSLLGLRRVPPNSGVLCTMMMGISTDEADRMKSAAMPWIRAEWPLIEKGMSRSDCKTWCANRGFPEPPSSSCRYCPFHDDEAWLAMDDAEIAELAQKERDLQAAYAQASAIHSVPYLHEKRIPLDQVVAALRAGALQPKPKQLSMFSNECEGMCGV